LVKVWAAGCEGADATRAEGDSPMQPKAERIPPGVVAFDDGFRGIWDERERFRAMGIRPIVFIAIDLVGKTGYLTWDEIRTLQNEYGFDFQSHTWSHQTLIGPCNSDLPIPSDPNFRTDEWYRHELVDSKNELERQLNLSSSTLTSNLDLRHAVSALCFPVGYFSDDVIRRCAAAGYTHLYASFPGNKEDSDSIVPLHLFSPPLSIFPRCLCQDLSLGDFKAVLAGGMNPLRRRYFALHYCDDTDDLK